jgi:adenylosuccinate lyase
MSDIKNVLASRYASPEMTGIFSEKTKVRLEREFWIAVLKAQRHLGLDIPAKAIRAYERVKDQIDLDKIRMRERQLRHDVKARIEEFCELAGFEHIHKGMTSRDLTDNVEQYRILTALKRIRLKTIRSLQLMAARADEYKNLVLTGRTHNVPAQPVTLGKRIAMHGQELLLGLENLGNLIRGYRLRGLKGAVGTLLDQETLFSGNRGKLRKLEEEVARHLGFERVLNAVGQIYPRSLDYRVVSTLFHLAAGPASFSRTLRLMAGQGLISEGFGEKQVGSSAMPHKMNARSSERISGFAIILQGYVTMTMAISGDQWQEGDVSCSVVRRVAIPDAFFTLDGLLETLMTVLQEMKAVTGAIDRELNRYLPFLATTTLMMAAVKKGLGREKAHAIIRKHAVAAAATVPSKSGEPHDLLMRLDRDPEFPLHQKELQEILKDPRTFTGQAVPQVAEFKRQVDAWGKKFPEASSIEPGKIL